MKSKIIVALAISIFAGHHAAAQGNAGYPITPVPFTNVHLNGGFWGNRLDIARKVTVPLSFDKCKESNRYKNFEMAAHPSDSNKPSEFPFDDTDVYKTIEGASYLMQTSPDKKMSRYIDSVLAIVAKAQEPDGYLYTVRTMNPKHPHSWSGPERWSKVEGGSHELYNLGHMLEGAVAHYQSTGKRNFLDIAIKYADCVCREIGPAANQKHVVPGHEIAEMGLIKLYLATKDKKYLDEAKYFVAMRGNTNHKDIYSQSHLPIIKQDEAVGHAVRAEYFYSGVADVAAITGDTAYINAIDRIWNNITGKKLYLTGGVGATGNGEAFGANYELPNATAYCETCAAIGNVYFNHRMFLLHGDAKYYDELERSLYNGVLSGISLDGGKFFYPNPLESAGNYERQAWFGCACCPSNLSRFMPSIGGYMYAVKDNNIYVNMYADGTTQLNAAGKKITLKQTTDYPYEGTVNIAVANGKGHFAMRVRIPGWTRGEVVPSDLYAFADGLKSSYSVTVNGKPVSSETDRGYIVIDRQWKKGDVVKLEFDMTPRKIVANEKVADDRGKVAIQRGPLVYCAEWPDNEGNDLFTMLIPMKAQMQISTDKYAGANKINIEAQKLSYDADGKLTTDCSRLTLIPYYAWANRGQGKMMVWMPYEAGAMHTGINATVSKNEFFK